MSDHETYIPLPSNPTNGYKKKELFRLIDESFFQKKILSKKEEHLVPMAPRVSVMYYLPKVHKDPANPPGRPIISGIDSVTSRIGRYINVFLQPLVVQTPSFLKDSTPGFEPS